MGERLRADDLLRTYDPSAAAERLGANVPKGSLTALVGPHTSGKSTLWHALALIVDPPIVDPPQSAVVLGGRPIVFGLRCRIINAPETDTPLVPPLGRAFRREPVQPPVARTRTTASTKITDKPMDHAKDHRAAAGSTRENATTGAPCVRA
ncbi:hypothetical protein ACFQ61_26900 [Streptomyces sp. NPDC056500]|uniref:hypothetical protein n=1 Tax=Streptomyces sp. NPDC056500 TaxID=3345840 RepID=UPI003679DF8D